MQTYQPERAFNQLISYDNTRLGDDLELCLALLANIDIEQVLAIDLSKPELGLAVVKVVIPGLEGAHGHWHGAYVPGRRAKQQLNRPFKAPGE